MKDINLIPEEYIRKKKRGREIAAGTVLSITAVCLLGILLGLPYYVLHSLDSIDRDLDGSIESLNDSRLGIDALKRVSGEEKAHKAVADTLSKSRFSASEIISDVAGCVPSGISLNLLTVDRTNISLGGEALDNGSISAFALNLRGLEGVKDVTIRTSDKGENEILSFRIDVIIKGAK